MSAAPVQCPECQSSNCRKSRWLSSREKRNGSKSSPYRCLDCSCRFLAPRKKENPETLETPEASERQEVPEALETPETPETPEALETPEASETPEMSEALEALEMPEAPETPEAPEIPATSADRVQCPECLSLNCRKSRW
ncbi:MAG: hypothetical protein LBD06_12255, partial [Candidatus Accumulibacter sp.]|nr:hypothetical protein [Accumulibacter sp.]